jgi:hypothetical protein
VLVLTCSGSAASRPMTCMRASCAGVVVEKERALSAVRRRSDCLSIVIESGDWDELSVTESMCVLIDDGLR